MVKYVCKYVNKLSDVAMIAVHQQPTLDDVSNKSDALKQHWSFGTTISGTFGKYIKRLFYKSKTCTSSNLSYRLLHWRSDITNYYHPITDGMKNGLDVKCFLDMKFDSGLVRFYAVHSKSFFLRSNNLRIVDDLICLTD